jgi:hypothetical protein
MNGMADGFAPNARKVSLAPSVAVRLADGSDFTGATAGKPDCYRAAYWRQRGITSLNVYA